MNPKWLFQNSGLLVVVLTVFAFVFFSPYLGLNSIVFGYGGGGGIGAGIGNSFLCNPGYALAPNGLSCVRVNTLVPEATRANNLTAEQRQKIAELLEKIKVLQAQIVALGGTVSNANDNPGFRRDLEVGHKGADVKALQVWLNSHGFTISSSGLGSSGNETDFFGSKTKEALIKFQKAKGITPASGYFGPKTRTAFEGDGAE